MASAALWPGAVDIPGRRQFRQLVGAAACGADYRPYGKGNVGWFVLAALLAIVVLAQISRWYAAQHRLNKGKPKAAIVNPLPKNKVILAVSILLMLIFSKYFCMASISSYYTFYLMQKFRIIGTKCPVPPVCLSICRRSRNGDWRPVGDKIGRKYVIWGSILGVAPFTLVLPYASLEWTGILTVIIGFILASAFSAILVCPGLLQGGSAWFLVCFSVSPLAWAALEPRCWGFG